MAAVHKNPIIPAPSFELRKAYVPSEILFLLYIHVMHYRNTGSF